jgi:hypothetical protein
MKLLDRVRQVMRTKHYSYRIEQTCCDWIPLDIRFHDIKLKKRRL